ncbi:MAG: aromatic ring-hydroxylating dioxygenase subunit alpha [Proteobacteria bacterium]|nr:aromatic ring-hydroxylating dioxygenase subunit alpha [Pseudomonadota bacterium]
MSTQTERRQVMPIQAYTSEDWFRREQRELFSRVWSFACMDEDLKQPGDYHCVQAGHTPLILLRDRENRLRAFHNTCRHRGTRLLEGRGNLGRAITCFYHSWSYDLAGRLIGVPHEREAFPGLDKSCYGLHAAKVATWKNLVFVHPDPDAEPLDRWLDDFPQKLGPHDPERLVEVADVLYRVRANWKIVIENFIDGYHLFHLHRVSLGDGDFTQQKWQPAGRHWTFYRPLKPGIYHNDQTLPVVHGVPSNYGAGAYVLFPNLALYETATFWLTFHVLPLAAGLSQVNVRTRANAEALQRADNAPTEIKELPEHILSAKGPHAAMRLNLTDIHPLRSDNVMLEDIHACEAVQHGMQSSACEIGPLSTYETSLPFFQRQILDFVPA